MYMQCVVSKHAECKVQLVLADVRWPCWVPLPGAHLMGGHVWRAQARGQYL